MNKPFLLLALWENRITPLAHNFYIRKDLPELTMKLDDATLDIFQIHEAWQTPQFTFEDQFYHGSDNLNTKCWLYLGNTCFTSLRATSSHCVYDIIKLKKIMGALKEAVSNSDAFTIEDDVIWFNTEFNELMFASIETRPIFINFNEEMELTNVIALKKESNYRVVLDTI